MGQDGARAPRGLTLVIAFQSPSPGAGFSSNGSALCGSSGCDSSGAFSSSPNLGCPAGGSSAYKSATSGGPVGPVQAGGSGASVTGTGGAGGGESHNRGFSRSSFLREPISMSWLDATK